MPFNQEYVTEDRQMFRITAPRSCAEFKQLPQQYNAYYIPETGPLKRIQSIGDFILKQQNREHPDDGAVEVQLEDGTSVKADSRKLLFEHKSAKTDHVPLLAQLDEPSQWVICQVYTKLLLVLVRQRISRQVQQELRYIYFLSPDKLSEFISKYDTGVIPGILTAAMLPTGSDMKNS